MEHRMTRQRRQILEALRNTTSHPTAEGVYRMLNEQGADVSLATVYRNLGYLVEEGIIRKVNTPHDSDHFDGDTREHYHIVCSICGRVDDVSAVPSQEMLRHAEEESGYAITGYEILFYGICKECRDKAETVE